MDLREKKKLRAIRHRVFAAGPKALEKNITVKEPCELAEISKATFYTTTGNYMTRRSGCRRVRQWQPFTTASATPDWAVSSPGGFYPRSFCRLSVPKAL